MVRIFTKKWSGPNTKKARSFYFVVGRYFLAFGFGRRRLGHTLDRHTPHNNDTPARTNQEAS